jgi:hypothetical protein
MARHPVGVYRERRSRLAGAVVWERVAGTTPFRVVPDGCMDLIWAAGALLVAGPDTSSHWVAGLPGKWLYWRATPIRHTWRVRSSC